MKEFKINEFLILKLEEDKPNIYVNGELFRLCKFLMLNIPIEKVDETESIDEVVDILGWTYDRQEGVEYDINPETEFWGLCSSLQVWYENNYDTRLLHSHLSFPLLKVLVEVGDPLAKEVFKEEIVRRIESNYPTVIACIINTHLLDYFPEEELNQLIKQNLLPIFSAIENLSYDSKLDILYNLIDSVKTTKIFSEYFPLVLEYIDNFPMDGRCHILFRLIELIRETDVFKEQFPLFLKSVDKLDDKDYIFSELIKLLKFTQILNEHLPAFLNCLDKLYYSDTYITNLIGEFRHHDIVNLHLPAFLRSVDNSHNKDEIISYLMMIFNTYTGIWEENIPLFLEFVDKLPNRNDLKEGLKSFLKSCSTKREKKEEE